jgi:hypothetical protein
MNSLKQLEACSQRAWLDYLKRSLIEQALETSSTRSNA